MTNFRQFSNSQRLAPKARTVDSDAPREFRNELVDLVFSLAAEPLTEYHLHRLMTQNIGASVSANPYGGYRYAIGRDLGRADWVRVYDLYRALLLSFDSTVDSKSFVPTLTAFSQETRLSGI